MTPHKPPRNAAVSIPYRGSCHTRQARRDPSQAREGVPCPLERPRQARRPRCDDHVHCPAWRDNVALLDIRPALPAANRLAREVVLVVQIRIKREEGRLVEPYERAYPRAAGLAADPP